MEKLDSKWVNNRNNTYLEKIARWLGNPIGAIVRIIEKLYFGNPLFLIIRGYGDLSEVRHLSGVLNESLDSESYQYFASARVSLKNRLILLDTGHISAPDHSSHSFLSGNLWKEVRTLQNAKNVKNYYKMVPMRFPEYYYHFLIDDIPSLLQTLRDNPDYVPIFQGEIPAFAHQVMKSLGLDFELAVSPIVEIKDMLVPRSKPNSMADFRSELELRMNFTESAENKPDAKIFIGRRNLPRGNLEYEFELFSFLKDFGFNEVNPDELSFINQAREFASASAIVSLHGGALSNLVFCSPGTRVIEVFNHEYRTYPFGRISRELGLIYDSFEAKELEALKRIINKEFPLHD